MQVTTNGNSLTVIIKRKWSGVLGLEREESILFDRLFDNFRFSYGDHEATADLMGSLQGSFSGLNAPISGLMSLRQLNSIYLFTGSSLIDNIDSANVNDVDLFILLDRERFLSLNNIEKAKTVNAIPTLFQNLGYSVHASYNNMSNRERGIVREGVYSFDEDIVKCFRVSNRVRRIAENSRNSFSLSDASASTSKSLNIIYKLVDSFDNNSDDEVNQTVNNVLEGFDMSVVQKGFFGTRLDQNCRTLKTSSYLATEETNVVTCSPEATDERKEAYSQKLQGLNLTPEWELE